MLPVLLGIIAARVIAGGVKNVIRYAEECGADLRDTISGQEPEQNALAERKQPTHETSDACDLR